MSRHHVFSHLTAAQIWGIPLPLTVDDGTIHVCAPAPARAPTGKAVTGHRFEIAAEHIRERGGLRLTSPALTWAHLSELLEPHDLVAAGDFVVTGNPFNNVLPLGEHADLEAIHNGGAPRRGRRNRETALPMVQEGALSRPESVLRYWILRAGAPAPQVNPSIVDGRGSFIAMPDLAWPEYTFAIEYEGDHHRSVRQYRRDVRRIEVLVDAGWSVMKVTADDLFGRPDETVARVLRRLETRGWRRTPSRLRHIGPMSR